MKEITGNLWEQDNCVVCVTTNGIVFPDGKLCMGAGCAKEARDKFPGIDKLLGDRVRNYGNVPHVAGAYQLDRIRVATIVSFPTKNHYKKPSELFLIKQSAESLKHLADQSNWKKIVIPRPGCGLGGLKWETVKKVLEPILDDRFYIIDNGQETKKSK